ncbi:molybdate ABC transporter substrate-binding protein [Rhodanobacter aciditrophus]|uniref:Molybdate ABC transporter substrate-binding protein n=1 Tax=Rhodanobacter aciditrophus TaxID=1623218 RepID=A0ABW4B1V5_9GAMM
MPFRTIFPACVLAYAFTSNMAFADTINVAVASNFTAPAKVIAANFEGQTGHEVELSFGSSGKFYAQISNGAPFEVFLSADQAKPEALIKEDLALAESRFTYAEGQLALWSADPEKVDPLGKILDEDDFNRLAMANPKLAPYGLAALQTLETLELVDKTQTKWVTGNNIAQTFQYVDTSNADIGFVALSQITQNNKITHGSVWIIPDEFYLPIRQDAVLMKSAERNAAAQEFLDYLKSDEAHQVIQSYGYKIQ